MAGLHEMKTNATYPAAFTFYFCNPSAIFVDADEIKEGQAVEFSVGREEPQYRSSHTLLPFRYTMKGRFDGTGAGIATGCGAGSGAEIGVAKGTN